MIKEFLDDLSVLSIVKHISVLNNVLGSHQVTNDQKYSCIVRDG